MGGNVSLPPPNCVVGAGVHKTIIQNQMGDGIMFIKQYPDLFSRPCPRLEAEQAAEQLANGTANRDPGKEEGKGLEDGPLVGISKFLWFIPQKVSTSHTL